MGEQSEFLTIDEAATFLGVSRRTMHEYARRGRLPVYKRPVGGRTVFRRSDLEKFNQPKKIRGPEDDNCT